MLPGVPGMAQQGQSMLQGGHPGYPQPQDLSTLGYFLKGWEDAGGWPSLPGMVGGTIGDMFNPSPNVPGYPHGIIPGLPPGFPNAQPGGPPGGATGNPRPNVTNASIVSSLVPRGPAGMGMGLLPLLMGLLKTQQNTKK